MVERDHHRALIAIAAAASVPIVALAFVAAQGTRNYHWAPLFLLPSLWGMVAFRERLRLAPLTFALFAAALILHDLGALGWYRRTFLQLSFDTYVHLTFGFAGALVLERAFAGGLRLAGWRLWFLVVLFLLGLSVLHELVEFGSTLVLGDHGMFKRDDPDRYDTQKDLFNNLLGALLAALASSASAKLASAKLARRGSSARASADAGPPQEPRRARGGGLDSVS